ncbi:MAG: hypothetical protein F6K22_35055 [Okeania sp. SIO2F4]|uniref:hypothetical protein n=1 Tax=Okeania sp. SIO2F4 TaxID=2607790 RepID=UPI00142B047A|nr:hypothetical protein [Okeania sp. SIO2F4]NES07550.1 hypothetical protein [Okeania sp. SIO2F4]
MSKVIPEFINSTKKSLVRSLALIVAATSAVILLSATSTNAQGGPLRGRVINMWECTENYGVLKGHNLAVVKVYDDRTGREPSTFVIYSTHPSHGLDRPEFLEMARDSRKSEKYLDFYWSEQKGSNVCGVTRPDRYHFLRNMRYSR